MSTKLRELITLTDRGIPMAGTTWTVEAYAKHWLDAMLLSLRPATHANYAWAMRKYIVPSIGTRKLDRLAPSDVRKLHADVASAGVSARTVQLAHAVLRSMLSEAMREQLVSRNVATLVRTPRLEKQEVTPWTADEVASFSLAASSHRLSALFTLAYSVGLRRGELLGLRWTDVDLARGLLHVRQTLQRLGADRGLVMGPPKSVRSRRTIPLPSTAASALDRHRREQDSELAVLPGLFNEHGLVFTTAIGTPIEPSNLRREFNALIEKAGVRRIRFHDLRHTCASLLFAQGVPPRVVMDLLGHSTLSITTDLYAHVMPSALVDAVAAMDALLSPEGDN
ncbi:tyrosine-type recombinase/integrase [Humibacter ginsengisoli]